MSIFTPARSGGHCAQGAKAVRAGFTRAVRRWRHLAALAAVTMLLAACGGGGGAGPAPASAPASEFPTLPASSFSLSAIAEPADRTPVAGRQQGRVLLADGAAAPAGLTVEWLDASGGAAPRVLASATTGAGGTFDMRGASAVASADQWLRVVLPDGTPLRAYASGWTEMSVGTEVALREIDRLRGNGAFDARALPMAELAAGQQSLGLLWQARFTAPAAADANQALSAFVGLAQPWNQYLTSLANATPPAGSGDIAMLLAPDVFDATVAATVSNQDGVRDTTVALRGIVSPQPAVRAFSMLFANENTPIRFVIQPQGIFLQARGGTGAEEKLMEQLGDLPLLEFAPAIGTRVIYDNPQMVATGFPTLHAAMKVTRRTYPAAPVRILGGATVMAIEVVLDYEISVVHTDTQVKGDAVGRERRWFSPLAGVVRAATEARARGDLSVSAAWATVELGAVTFASPTMLPPDGAIDTRALPLAHRDAVHAAALNRIFVATDDNGGTILELDAATLATLRSVATAGLPSRLALSADGSRLYAGLDGGAVIELRTADLGTVHRFTLGAAEFGQGAYDLVRDLAVDPFDAERVLVLAGHSPFHNGGNGPVMMFSAGKLAWRDAPRYTAWNYGWDSYSPGTLAWSPVRDEFLVSAIYLPTSLYRFRAGATAVSELAALVYVDPTGVREVGGELLTPKGKILDARTLATLRELKLDRFPVSNCSRLDARSDWCLLNEMAPTSATGTYARLDNASGALLATYRLPAPPALAPCQDNPVPRPASAAGSARLTPMGNGRLLVSNGASQTRCGLQIWSLRGYQP